jgi:hypothetical protein
MPFKRLSALKALTTTVACFVAAYLTFVFFGGFLVFGFRNLAEFCVVVVPLLILPVSLLGYRYPALSAVLSLAVMCIFFGTLLSQTRQPLPEIFHMNLPLFKFLLVSALLALSAIFDYFQKTQPATSA